MHSKKLKIHFIRELVANVERQIITNVDKMPDNWDGIELRQYIADRFADVVLKDTMSRKRAKEYRNTVIVQNI